MSSYEARENTVHWSYQGYTPTDRIEADIIFAVTPEMAKLLAIVLNQLNEDTHRFVEIDKLIVDAGASIFNYAHRDEPVY